MGRWDHLGSTLDFEKVRSIIGIEFQRLRNIHRIEFFRDGSGIYCHWKQFLTDEMWSRAILLVSASQFPQIAKLVPPVIEHEFSQTQSEQHLHFVRQLGRNLAAQNQYEQHESGLQWLEMVATNDWGYVGVPINEILEDLKRLGSGVPLSDAQDNFPVIPDDVMLQVAPGADIANQPADMLVTVNGVAGGQRVQRKSYVTPGDWIIVKAVSLPFFVGALMDWDDENLKGYVRWLHPEASTQELFKVGRKRKITDIFGSWTWADELQLDKLHVLPPVKSLGRIGHFICCDLLICVCACMLVFLDWLCMAPSLWQSKGQVGGHPGMGF